MPHLSRKLVLEDAYRTPDGSGGFATEWQDLGTLWAEIKPGRGGQRLDDETGRTVVPLQIVVRSAPFGAPSRPRAGQRFREGERIYSILAVEEQDASGHYLAVRAQEEGTP